MKTRRTNACGRRVATAVILCLSGALAGSVATADGSPAPRRPSRLKAIGASLLLPGLGHRYVGHPGRAKVFFATEAGLLIGYGTGRVQSHVQKQSYIEYAERFAGVENAGGKPDWYYRNVGQYRSSDEYVDDIERAARQVYGDDLAQRDAYVRNNSPREDERWAWQSEAARLEYTERRRASRNALRRANLFLGAAVLNRLVSAIDAARMAGGSERSTALFYRPSDDGPGYLCVRWIAG
jgi:hypothetical protein